VVGFDTRAYLASFTSAGTTVRSQQEPVDYRALIEFASGHSGKRPTFDRCLMEAMAWEAEDHTVTGRRRA
jgi:hypothetical protein